MQSRDIQSGPPLAAVVALLSRCGLPVSDLTQAHLAHFFYVGAASEPDGLVGLEICGSHALLRSLVVSPELRTDGLGRALVDHAEAHARTLGVCSIFLLTTTAEAFFLRRGYVRLDRAGAPPEIRATREFADICPAGSAFMAKRLD